VARGLNEATRMKSALVFILVGMIVEVFCIYDLKPLTFVVFAGVAVPLVVAGIAIFLATVWRVLKETRGL
jgi:hypothetical protein